MEGYDPILLEKKDGDEWLKSSPDNFLLILEDDSILCLKKSYFLNPQTNDIYLKCKIEKDALILNETRISKLYRNIGYYFDKYTMIEDKELIRNLKKKKNIYRIKTKSYKSEDIVPMDEWLNEDTFINQEVLLLTQIGLFKSKKISDKLLFKRNIEYKEDVYFNDLISKALYNYSWQWDGPINRYLRLGDAYFESAIFIKYMSRYGNNKETAIKNIKDKIEYIDRCFMEFAPRNQNDKKKYYRGMTQGYGFKGLNDEIIVRNFTSVSEDINIAFRFYNKMQRCCIHEITIDKGIPYINMVTNTKFKQEKEILIPRDVVFKLVGFRNIKLAGGGNVSVRKIHISKMTKDQFKLDTGCNKYPIVSIEALTKKKMKLDKPIKKEKLKGKEINVQQNVPNDVEVNLKPAVLIKKPRCPNGSKRDKMNGLCVDKDGNVVENNNNKKENKTIKKKRCPNGQRRNKKTGNCQYQYNI